MAATLSFPSASASKKTFDKTGKVAKVWKSVKSDGHAEKVLEALADLG